jgi:hypothetical protein
MLETLPLWLELDGLRIAHACWSEKAIDIIKKRRPSGHLQLEDLEEVAAKTTRVSGLLCMSKLVHASDLKEHDDNDDIQRTTRRTA